MNYDIKYIQLYKKMKRKKVTNKMLCNNCSKEFDNTYSYCPQCGEKLTNGKIVDIKNNSDITINETYIFALALIPHVINLLISYFDNYITPLSYMMLLISIILIYKDQMELRKISKNFKTMVFPLLFTIIPFTTFLYTIIRYRKTGGSTKYIALSGASMLTVMIVLIYSH